MSTVAAATSANPLRRLLAQRYTPPFRDELPGTMAALLEQERPLRTWRENGKLLKRWLMLRLSRQHRLLHDRLPPPPARLLWLSPSSNSIGDSIMELAGRALLGAYEVDLLADKYCVELYRKDRYLRAVFSDPAAIDPSRYDFGLQDFFNTRSLRLKRRVCPSLPFATLQGFFAGADYNRILFSCYRIHHLLGYPHTAPALRPFLRPRLFLADEPSPLPRERGKILRAHLWQMAGRGPPLDRGLAFGAALPRVRPGRVAEWPCRCASRPGGARQSCGQVLC
jgi:hypothetical protein